MILMGSFMVGAAAAYHCMLPSTPLVIRFQDDKFLLFRLGWCFWLTLFTGSFARHISYYYIHALDDPRVPHNPPIVVLLSPQV